MTTATKAGGAVLPVVCYVAQRDGLPKFGAGWMFSKIETGPATLALTPHAPAQATIDELRAEVERLWLDAERWRAMREKFTGYDFADKLLLFRTECADVKLNAEGADACADALRASLLGDGGTL